MAFKHATKKAAKLRCAIAGPAGSGKTYSALAIATNIGSKVALLDTEHESASKYADLFSFDSQGITNFAPRSYVDAIHEAEKDGYDVLVIDSLSHAWNGTGGVLEIAGGNFNNWKAATPAHNSLVEAMLAARIHIIATMRTKTEWVVETVEKDGRTKTCPRKVGTAPVQRDGIDYEMDVFGVMDESNTMRIEKTRCPALANRMFHEPGKEFASLLLNWLGSGAVDPAFDAALASGMDLISTRPFDELGSALKGHIESIPDAIRDDVRARLIAAYKTREAAEKTH